MVALTGYVLYLNWRLAAFSVIVLPLAGFALSKFSKRFRKASTSMQEQSAFSRRTSMRPSAVSGSSRPLAWRNTKAGGSPKEQEPFQLPDALDQDQCDLTSRHGMISIFGTSLVILFGLFAIAKGTMTVGDFFSFMTALVFFYRPLKELNGVNSMVQDGVAAAKRIFEVLDTEPEIKNKPGALTVSRDIKCIEFRDLSFKYEK